jgi:hypothetical protein
MLMRVCAASSTSSSLDSVIPETVGDGVDNRVGDLVDVASGLDPSSLQVADDGLQTGSGFLGLFVTPETDVACWG